jgi:hypothetical protein
MAMRCLFVRLRASPIALERSSEGRNDWQLPWFRSGSEHSQGARHTCTRPAQVLCPSGLLVEI